MRLALVLCVLVLGCRSPTEPTEEPQCRVLDEYETVTSTGDTVTVTVELCDVRTEYRNPRIP